MLHAISTSDWHLCGGLSNVFPGRALSKQMPELEKIFDYAVTNNIRHVFHQGDISDKARLDEDTFIALVQLLLKYDPYVSFYYILGNHDVAHVGRTSIEVLQVFVDSGALKNVHIMKAPEVREIDGVEVGFVPFPFKALPEDATDCPKIICAHVEEAGAIGDNGLPLKSQHLKVERHKDDFVFSGHLHTYQVLKNKRMVFNGAPYQKTFGEQGPKGFVEFRAKYVGDQLKVAHKFVDIRPEFTLINLAINSDQDFDKLERNENCLYKVTLGEGVIAPKELTREFPNIVMLNGVTYKGRNNTSSAEKMSAADIPKITPLTGLVRFLHEHDLSKEETKKAVRMVKDAMAELQMM